MPFAGSLFAFASKSPPIHVTPADLEHATTLLWGFVALVLGYFVVRPEQWKRAFMEEVDPRPAALVRILFGTSVLWAFVTLTPWAELLFTDEGMYLPEMARKRYSPVLAKAWDPEHGFEDWWALVRIAGSNWSILHIRSDPTFVYTIYALLFLTSSCMIVGFRTRVATVLTWILANSLYNYTPIFYTGADTVVRVMLFLSLFMRWGEAYSVDAWLRRRKAILGGAERLPGYRKIPVWPQRLMMVQLAVIYCATGLLKNGSTWANGTAIYYAMHLDHFYRFPGITTVAEFLHAVGVLPVATIVVHWWEMLFPLALVGLALRRWSREREAGTWPPEPIWRRLLSWLVLVGALLVLAELAGLAAYYHYDVEHVPEWLHMSKDSARQLAFALVVGVPTGLVLIGAALWRWQTRFVEAVLPWVGGKRLWLGIGAGMHLGIGVTMNVGIFVPVMIGVYPAWLRGDEVEASWKLLASRAAAPGEAGRPERKRAALAWLLAPVDRLRHRVPRASVVVLHGRDEGSVRRAALLRCWDLCGRLEFEASDEAEPGRLCVRGPGGEVLRGGDAGAQLQGVLPGLWLAWLPGTLVELCLAPLGIAPAGLRSSLGRVSAAIVSQRA